MATYFDQFHQALVRIVPDFGRLRAKPHKADPRAATSVVIAGMTLGLAVMLGLTVAQPVRIDAPPRSVGQVAPPPAADKVTIVSANPALDVPCAEQTWPYIDRRCLTETTQKRPQPEAQKVQEAAAPIDATKATAPIVPVAVLPAPVASETQRMAVRETTGSSPAADHPAGRVMANRNSEAEQTELNQTELNNEIEPMPAIMPRDQFRRGERRRVADPGRRFGRQWREFSRRVIILPRGLF